MDHQDLLYRYFSNILTFEEEKEFQKLLKTDAAFKAQFEFENNLKKSIKSYNKDKLRSKLKAFEAELEGKKAPSSIFKYQKVAIAASIVLLIGWFGYHSFFCTNYAKLYANNFSTYPNTVYTITRGDENNSLEREAFVAYESKAYKKAIEKFNKITSSTVYISFYKAQSYLAINDLVNAKKMFEKVQKTNAEFTAEATWYLALIALKEKNKKEAIKHLKNLVANYSYNKDKAQALLVELN